MRKAGFLAIAICSYCTISAQSYHSRVLIAMLLHHAPKDLSMFRKEAPTSALLLPAPAGTSSFTEPIPKYSLPKGSVICRFEEYVQLHSPMKLNIGLDGQ